MKSAYLWDTNTVIYFLQQQFTPIAAQKIDEIITTNVAAISIVTEIELLSWQLASEEDIRAINSFLWNSKIYLLDNDTKLQTIAIRKQSRLKLPDAVIAATALVYDLTLITRNVADFGRVRDLKILNPYEGNTSR